MANTQTPQAFYGLTLEAPSAVTAACICNVIPNLKRQDQQIFEARGQRVSLKRIEENADRTEVRMETILEQDTFGIVRGVCAVSIPGTGLEYLIIASDSGRVTMVAYDDVHNRFRTVHQETFGKSGIRRSVPGQYLAGDPKGRCFMLASTEKNKLVYLVRRGTGVTSDGHEEILISSPHEANQWGVLCFALTALETGWENPIFASLEVNYTDVDTDGTGELYDRREKQLVYYVVDTGLNHVLKSWSDTVDYTANMLFAVPGGDDGPSGVIVCAEGRIYYKHDKYETLSIPIPRRSGALEDPDRARIIISGSLHVSKARKDFWFLLQTDDGDVFKLTIEMALNSKGQQTVTPLQLHMKYYETYPRSNQIMIVRKGYIYLAAENGHSKLYHVNDLADDLDFEPWNNFTSEKVSADYRVPYERTFFHPRGLRYTSVSADIPSLHPLVRARVENLTGEDAPQIYVLQGAQDQSALKTIRHGLPVNDFVSSPAGDIHCDNIWSLKQRASDKHHAYLVLTSSYADRTIVLSVDDDVETVDDTLFLTNRHTMVATLMGDATFVQVHARGVHSIMEDETTKEWQSPSHRTIIAAAANERQLLLGLSSSELVFFFLDDDGMLSQLDEMPEMSGKITAVGIGPTPLGQTQAKYAVVGCDDCTIRVVSIHTQNLLEAMSVQALSAVPTSLEMIEQIDPDSGSKIIYVHIGLQSGLYLRATIDEVTGELGDVRTKFLGARPTRLFSVEVADQNAVVACSSKTWLGYNHPQTEQFTLAPLITDPLEAVAKFRSEHLSDETYLCGIKGNTLLIFSIPSVDGRLHEEKISLQYSPRNFTRNIFHPILYVVESDANTLSKVTREELMLARGNADLANGAAGDVDPDGAPSDLALGLPRGPGHWASCVQAVDPVIQKAVTSTIEFTDNEAAFCCVCVAFESRDWECFLAVGTGQHMTPGQESATPPKGYVHIFRLLEDGTQMEFYHKTEFEAPVLAMLPFHGMLAVGAGQELFIFDLGMRALLRKTRGVVVPNNIMSLDGRGSRIVAGDICESVTYIKFKIDHNRLIPFVDDSIRRWTTAMTMLDYETTAGGDKFGNIWIVRCPEQASKESDEDGLGGFLANERGYLGGSPYRLELRAHNFVQDVPTSIQRTALNAGGQELVFWSGIQGTLGIVVPFVARSELEFFSQLESLIRKEEPPLSGRDHLMYRCYYVPVKSVVDGDLCERFLSMSNSSKQKVAAGMDQAVKEIEKRIIEIRTRVAF